MKTPVRRGKPNKLTAYRRHASTCPEAAAKNSLNCDCPIWVHGRVKGKFIRTSLGTRSLDAANDKIRRMLSGDDDPPPSGISIVSGTGAISIEAAKNAFVASKTGKGSATQLLYRRTVESFVSFAAQHAVIDLGEIRSSLIEQFFRERSAWSQRTKIARLTNLRVWLNYCVDQEWLRVSPAKKKALTFSRPTSHVRQPFTHEEVERILAAAESAKARAFLLLLLYSGMRISDATFLERDAIDAHGILDYVVIKTRKRIELPLELQAPAREALANVDPGHGSFYFVPGVYSDAVRARHEGRELSTALPPRFFNRQIAQMRHNLVDRVLKRAGVSGTPHSFRDTFAVNMLTEGADIFAVSQFLGHSDVRITQRHYMNLVKNYRQRMSHMTRSLKYPISKAS